MKDYITWIDDDNEHITVYVGSKQEANDQAEELRRYGFKVRVTVSEGDNNGR